KPLLHIFARQTARQQIGDVVGGVRTKIEAGTVQRIDKARSVPNRGPPITANFLTVIWQYRQGMHVALDRACLSENLATDGVAKDVCVQPVGKIRAFRQFENPIVVHNAGAHVTALQGNDPNPPATAEQMIRSPFTASATMIGVVREAFPPFVAVPLLDAAEARPYSVDGMLGVRTKMSQLPGEHSRAACGINYPTRPNGTLVRIWRENRRRL